MEAKELRVGNYFTDGDLIHIVTPITIECLFASPNRVWCQPVQLTEEWLAKFSFVLDRKIGQRNIYRHGKYGGIKCEVCRSGEAAIYINDNLIGFKRFVHSFQNLFHALTDEELKASEVTT